MKEGAAEKQAVIGDWPEASLFWVWFFFTIIFFRNKENLVEQVNGRLGETREKTTRKSSQKIPELIQANSGITIDELALKTGISDRAIKKNLFRLKKKGLLKRVGPDKGGHWEAAG